jgi:hypothetical protein
MNSCCLVLSQTSVLDQHESNFIRPLLLFIAEWRLQIVILWKLVSVTAIMLQSWSVPEYFLDEQ